MRPISTSELHEGHGKRGFLYGGLTGLLMGAAVCAPHLDQWPRWQTAAVLLAFVMVTGAIGHLARAARSRTRSPDLEGPENTVWERLAEMGNALDVDD